MTRLDAVFLHIAAWTPREPASTVPHGTSRDLGTANPPTAWDYLDGDGMVMVSDHHFLLTPSGLRPKTIEYYIKELLKDCRVSGVQLPDEIERFELIAIANDDVMTQIRAEGAKEISLGVGQYLETARVGAEEYHQQTISRRIARSILDIFVTGEDRRRVAEASNVEARLTIKLDGRRAGLLPRDLIPIANQVSDESEEGDRIEIVTGRNNRIKSGRLVLRKPVEVDTLGKTVSHNHIWEEMKVYLDELRDMGALEE